MSEKLAIAATRDGFRRCGRAWGVKPQIVSASDFTEEQLEALRADPNIIVTDGAGLEQAPAEDDPAGLSPFFRDRLVRLATAAAVRDGTAKPTVADLKAVTGIRDITAAERDTHLEAIKVAAGAGDEG